MKQMYLIFSILLIVFFSSCQNHLLEEETGFYKVSFVTNCDTKIESYRTDRINSFPEIRKNNAVFDGWYTNNSFDGNPIQFPYEVKKDTTLYAKWISENKIYTFDFRDCKSNSDFINICKYYGYDNGILILDPSYEEIIFKGSSSVVFNDLCIKISAQNTKLVFDNFSFSSSKASPLIESSSNVVVQYNGTNKLLSEASSNCSLIKSLGTITIKGNDGNSKIELQPNAVTNSTEGSIGVEASKVIIDDGNFVILESNGVNYPKSDKNGKSGRNGSSGIKANETVIRNNAIVTIIAGNGAPGSSGQDGARGKDGKKRAWIWEGNAQNGQPGQPGQNCGIGGFGGHAIVGDLIIESCNSVTLKAGNGANGTAGSRGGDGGRGGNNEAWGGRTGSGGDAGRGSNGSRGGDGGDAVTGTLYYRGNINDTVYLTAGIGGEGGSPGMTGTPGAPGTASPLCNGGGQYGKVPICANKGSSGQDGVKHR